MTSNYQAPHVAVRQQFTPAAPTVGVPGLPAAVYGPAFSVYEKAGMGSVDGINNAADILPWLGSALLEKAVFDSITFDAKIYDRYPVKIFLRGYGEKVSRLLSSSYYTKNVNGTVFSGTPSFIIGSDENNADGVQGTTSGFMPYTSGAITVSLGATDKVLNDTSADFITAKIQPGQTVHIQIDTLADVITTVKRIVTATQLELSTAVGIATSGKGYTIGSDAYNGSAMEDFFDLSGRFQANNVQVGDLLVIVTNQGLNGSASIKQILSDTWIKVCIGPADNRNLQSVAELNTLLGDSGLTSVTQSTLTYSVERYFYNGVVKGCVILQTRTSGADDHITVPSAVGTLLNNKNITIYNTTKAVWLSSKVTNVGGTLTLLNTGKVFLGDSCDLYCQVSAAGNVAADKTKLTVPGDATGYTFNFKAGDMIKVTYASAATQECVIIAAVKVGNDIVFTLQGAGLNKATSTVISSVEYFSYDWTYTSDVFTSYRASKFTLSGKILVANTVDDITLFVGSADASDGGINEYNDLGYMAFLAWTAGGGRTVYMGCTDGTSQNEGLEYAKARDAMKFFDIYAQAFATFSPDINAAAGPYCDAEADPYAGHERVGYVAYSWEDLMKIATGSATATVTGVLTDSAAHFQDEGVSINDLIEITSGGVVSEARVGSILGNTQIVLADLTKVVTSGDTYVLSKGNKTAQAGVIASISQSLYNRRVTHVWEGDFLVTDTRFGTRILPGFFACAAAAGWNSSLPASQGMTNSALPVLIATPRYSDAYFGRDDLDIIAGGGTFILTQAAPNAGLLVRHQLTTNNDSPKTGEDSVRRQVDTAAKVTRNTYRIYIGKANIETDFIQFLSNEVWSTIVTNLKNRKVVRDMQLLEMKQNPDLVTGVIAKVKVTPFYPLNDMDITLII